jgi:hypothetical protein
LVLNEALKETKAEFLPYCAWWAACPAKYLDLTGTRRQTPQVMLLEIIIQNGILKQF